MSFIKMGGEADMSDTVPFYVTRETGDGTIYNWGVGLPTAMFILVVGQVVFILWLLIALFAGCIVAGNFLIDTVSSVV